MFQFLKTGYDKIKEALGKTRSVLSWRLRTLFSKPLSDESFEELEQILFEADLGQACALAFIDKLKQALKKEPLNTSQEILLLFRSYALELLSNVPPSAPVCTTRPETLLIVGVNGTGKTTSIAKLAHRFAKDHKKVLLGAADTFRAAAIDQLQMWGSRLGVDVIRSQPGADPAAVAFDTLTAAKARDTDVVLIDTAGRLQNKTDLMRELEKIHRTLKKVVPDAPHQTLLVLDATTGQNALDQAKAFHAATPLDGIIVAKLDGSAKGGIILSLYQELKVPVLWVGTGEGAEDLAPFDPQSYVNALFEV